MTRPILLGVLLPVLAAALFTFTDPTGDAHGDGSYVLPKRPPVTASMLDLQTFTAEPTAGRMTFNITLAEIGNPYQAPGGYSAGVTDIFVQGARTGRSKLDGTGLDVRNASWTYHLHVTGFGAYLKVFDANTRELKRMSDPTVQLHGRTLTVQTVIPAGRYAYWVTNSLYSPISVDGVVWPTTTRSPLALQSAREGAPSPVDVLAPPEDRTVFTSRTLEAVGQARDTFSTLLAGLGLLGVSLILIGWIARRRIG